eukprot:g888.t1
MEWTFCEEPVSLDRFYARSATSGRNVTSCKTAMNSICSQFRSALKRKYAKKHSDITGGSVRHAPKLADNDTEYRQYVHRIFEQFDTDGDHSVGRDEFLIGLFSLGIQVTPDEAELVIAMFGADTGHSGAKALSYRQFCDVIFQSDSTRLKKLKKKRHKTDQSAHFLPPLSNDEALRKMNRVSKSKRQERIRKKSAAARLMKLHWQQQGSIGIGIGIGIGGGGGVSSSSRLTKKRMHGKGKRALPAVGGGATSLPTLVEG